MSYMCFSKTQVTDGTGWSSSIRSFDRWPCLVIRILTMTHLWKEHICLIHLIAWIRDILVQTIMAIYIKKSNLGRKLDCLLNMRDFQPAMLVCQRVAWGHPMISCKHLIYQSANPNRCQLEGKSPQKSTSCLATMIDPKIDLGEYVCKYVVPN